MLLNTFAPPFRLVGGYFVAGVLFLLISIFAFFKADFAQILSLSTAGFAHIFFVGFVMSIIVGALYQLTSVILEKAFFTISGAFLNFILFCTGTLLLGFGLLYEKMAIFRIGGDVLFLSLLFFCLTFLLSFINSTKNSFAKYALLISGLFLLVGITFGFLLILILSGTISFDFKTALHFHMYFVLGFVFFIIVGVSTVLLPMFALSHDVKFLSSKISLFLYIVAGFCLYVELNLALVFIGFSILCFIFQAFLIMKKRVRKAFDYWNLNVTLSLFSLIIASIFIYFGKNEIAIWFFIYGFLYAFIVAHLYKIAPFLIWYHYIAPFVGKTKVPLLDNMILKKPAYIALSLNVVGIFSYIFWANFAVVFIFASIFLVCVNMINFFKYTNFGENYER
ncbi:peptidase M50 [Campylobacter mucosalis]|uniref:peptidase M50 n=1 Tax=Campylobacter mucosalis TaxID=202 RepID=UPI00147072B4|nr:peptidase M50 [Campylobacter mucosalis]